MLTRSCTVIYLKSILNEINVYISLRDSTKSSQHFDVSGETVALYKDMPTHGFAFVKGLIEAYC